ncbi:MAG: DUF262 domain-containing protein [Nitrospirae bacterium]|nr:DUF262 domain-containing protein [Nitrospirota bacterium]
MIEDRYVVEKNGDARYEGDDLNDEDDFVFIDYEITAAPNDFNIATLFSFIEKDIISIPGFQRNYVWDIKRASKLIESIIIGIPIPQIFLFETARNKFLVIDGQQRYMTIYYFMKKRFPRFERRSELRIIFDKSCGIPDDYLNNDDYFQDFKLQLSGKIPGKINKFNKLSYDTIDDGVRTSFDLRTIRNIIIKQNSPNDNNSALFEIFNRLNTGGLNLTPQEIRTSLYHTSFYDMLYRLNIEKNWRTLNGQQNPDIHMKDVEVLLRGFAMLINGENYKSSMKTFLNSFSMEAKGFEKTKIEYLEKLYNEFLNYFITIGDTVFFGKGGWFNISVYESVFYASCLEAYRSNSFDIKKITLSSIEQLKNDKEFSDATLVRTSQKSQVQTRLRKAIEILLK